MSAACAAPVRRTESARPVIARCKGDLHWSLGNRAPSVRRVCYNVRILQSVACKKPSTAADWPVAGGVLRRQAKSRDLELTARNSRLPGIKFLIQTKPGSQIEEYSTPRTGPIGTKLEALACPGDCLCRRPQRCLLTGSRLRLRRRFKPCRPRTTARSAASRTRSDPSSAGARRSPRGRPPARDRDRWPASRTSGRLDQDFDHRMTRL